MEKMMDCNTCKTGDRRGESGNVLFLILIAVALFAALSYAVTQSTRSGSNDSEREQSLISSAQITQYPAGVRTSMVRMILGGVDSSSLYFNAPSDFGSGLDIADTDGNTTDEERAVFHPAGGGAPYQLAQPDVMSGNTQGEWIFSDLWEVAQIGSTLAADARGNDVVALLSGISRSLCVRINEEYGINVGTDGDGDGVPAGPTVQPDIATHGMTIANEPAFNANEVATLTGDFTGQPYGCYDRDDGDASSSVPDHYIYYHVLLER